MAVYQFLPLPLPTPSSYSQTAYCDVTGRETRLPLKIRGEGLGPHLVFSYDSLDVQNVFLDSGHSYEVRRGMRGTHLNTGVTNAHKYVCSVLKMGRRAVRLVVWYITYECMYVRTYVCMYISCERPMETAHELPHNQPHTYVLRVCVL